MKNWLLPSLLLLLALQTKAGIIHANMRNCIFLSEKDSSYVETQFTVTAKDLSFIQRDDKKYEATVEVTLLYMKDSIVFNHFKYLLFSEAIDDTASINFNLTDLKRINLPKGDYTIELYLKDENETTSTNYLWEGVTVDYNIDSLMISDIELVESYKLSDESNVFTKRGYEILPLAVEYFPTAMSSLNFYSEIYHADKLISDENYVITVFIHETTSQSPYRDLVVYSKQKPSHTSVIFSSFDLSKLPTGSYFITLEVRTRKNELLGSRSLFFYRSNTLLTFNPSQLDSINVENIFSSTLASDSLNFWMQSLYPIASNEEKNYIEYFEKTKSETGMRAFIYKFWKDRNPTDPLNEWMAYKNSVMYAEENFKTPNRHGFETDMGRVYLQYGPPSDALSEKHEPGAYPYEIWHYYFIKPNQTNVRFVFYNPDLVIGDYKLIHSDALGEIRNPRWQYLIYDAVNKHGSRDSDVTKFPEHFGSRVDDYFKE